VLVPLGTDTRTREEQMQALCDCSNGGGTCDCPHRRAISEAAFELIVDTAVQGRLLGDRRYRNAENAEAQAEAEEAITAEVLAEKHALYRIEAS
jgi:hypothetical protein